ncbi:splicing factor 3a subunit [Anaeramoeba flamelloides]|uniref:Splicing factor 3a subunit n=1 Tax=Anaeramoeba flamelloides TaxID=1746091 RepID=A0AAV7ZS55_9EUKA|nr:splicing factor 3a subunit [Anaeramoeba flamelloides]
MSGSLLEQTRSLQEEIEKVSSKSSSLYGEDYPSFEETVMKQHRIARMIKNAQESSKKLSSIYKDKDKIRKMELETMSGENVFNVFYEKLVDIKNFHRITSEEEQKKMFTNLLNQKGYEKVKKEMEQKKEEEEEQKEVEQDLKVAKLFSGPETFGQFIDLYSFYNAFINLNLLKLEIQKIDNPIDISQRKRKTIQSNETENEKEKEKEKEKEQQEEQQVMEKENENENKKENENEIQMKKENENENSNEIKEENNEDQVKKENDKEKEEDNKEEENKKEKTNNKKKNNNNKKKPINQKANEMPSNKLLDYLSYLKIFQQFEGFQKRFQNKLYPKYLANLYNYLINFIERSRPLFNVAKLKQVIETEFNKDLTHHKLDDLFRDQEETILYQNPLYCKYCKKLFTNKNVFKYHDKGKRHLIGVKNWESYMHKEYESRKEILKLEYYIKKVCIVLAKTLQKSIGNIQRKQTLTYYEITRELRNLKKIESKEYLLQLRNEKNEKNDKKEEFDDEDDEAIKNPKNVPLDYDNRPIQYWMYKLHGLSVTYKCEICGGASYRGRKAFQDHFQKWKHSYGMKCLGIPNTEHFHEITSIDEAKNLYEKLKNKINHQKFSPDENEEFEDSSGTILPKKTYELMKKQQLL